MESTVVRTPVRPEVLEKLLKDQALRSEAKSASVSSSPLPLPPPLGMGATIALMKRKPNASYQIEATSDFGRNIEPPWSYEDKKNSIAGTLHHKAPNIHGALEAVHSAFSSEFELVLRPDDILLLWINALSIRVNSNPKEFAPLMGIDVDRKETIVIVNNDLCKTDTMPVATPKWAKCFPLFAKELTKSVLKSSKGLCEILNHSFSTTNQEEDILVRTVMIMDTLKTFVDYRVDTFCGITKVHLKGQKEDWKKLLEWIKPFGEWMKLPLWAKAMHSVMQKFVDAYDSAKKEKDLDFWNSIYKWHSWSGGNYVNGWFILMFPFGKDGQPLGIPVEDEKEWAANRFVESCSKFGAFPSGLCRVPFTWKYFRGGECPMQFCAGFAEPKVDLMPAKNEGRISMQVGWSVNKIPSVVEPFWMD